VLLTTHYMEEAARLCDRVAIVDRGKLLALGPPRELVASLGAEHVIEIETEGIFPDEVFADLPGVERVLREGELVRLTVREVHRVVPPLLARFAQRNLEARRFATHHATLEDVFLALTGRTLDGEAAA
jgi:ABC-2 type transport system ATP-binding protein